MSFRPTAEEIAAKSAKNRAAHVKRIAGANFAVSGPVEVDNRVDNQPSKESKRLTKKGGKVVKCPTEHQEQCAVIAWANTHPLAYVIFAIPNGSHKSPAMAAKFQREGLRKGVPDLFLPVPSGRFHGLFIEMKRGKGSVTGDEQLDWVDFLRSQGYAAHICKGADAAIRVIKEYLVEL